MKTYLLNIYFQSSVKYQSNITDEVTGSVNCYIDIETKEEWVPTMKKLCKTICKTLEDANTYTVTSFVIINLTAIPF